VRGAARRRRAGEVPRQPLDDDLGAHVGEQHAAERAGEDTGQVDNADAREWHWWNSPARMVAAKPSVMPAALAWLDAAEYGLTLSVWDRTPGARTGTAATPPPSASTRPRRPTGSSSPRSPTSPRRGRWIW